MTQFDLVYNKLVKDILEKGIMSEGEVRTRYADGTPAHYKSIIGYQFRLDNSGKEAQLITSRRAPWKSALREAQWIWINQSNDVDVLNRLGCKFWDLFRLEDGTIGPAYGKAIATKTMGYDNQLDYVIRELKKNPNSRRIMTEIWIPEDLHKMALTPCVHLTSWAVVNGKLYLEVRQRSCDVALGLVSNVFQYSVLHKLVAQECGLEPAEMIWTIFNAHLYDRHIPDMIYLMEEFDKRKEETGKPIVLIDELPNIYNFLADVHVSIEDYKWLKVDREIKFEVAI